MEILPNPESSRILAITVMNQPSAPSIENAMISTEKNFDVAVVGAGMAGLSAAFFSARAGFSTVVVGHPGKMVFASGLLDLMGIMPEDQVAISDNPWEGIDRITSTCPSHPYANLKKEEIRRAFDNLLAFFKEQGLSYRGLADNNLMVPTGIGTMKPTYRVPESMWNGVKAAKEKVPCLIADIAGINSFSARQMVQTLKPIWPSLRSSTIKLPGQPGEDDIYMEKLALKMDTPEAREELARSISPHLEHISVLGLPAIVGLYRHQESMDHISSLLGIPVFEIPTLPPSVSGMRIRDAFENGLRLLGSEMRFQDMSQSVRILPSGEFRLCMEDIGENSTFRARAVILATGRFLGKGLHAGREKITEPLMNLPVYQPGSREHWHRDELLDRQGHPINQAGIETDNSFRPLSEEGLPVHPNLFAAGTMLAHQDWTRTKSGSGIAISTAYGCVKALTKQARQL